MIARLGMLVSGVFRRLMPDPFVLAILLTFVTLILARSLTDTGLTQLVDVWASRSGMWALLAFGMQMCLILVTGHALASSPPVARLLAGLAGRLRGPRQAVFAVATVAGILGVLNWGLGLIAGAILARRVGEVLRDRGVPVHYPLLAAAGYFGLLVWHGGFSGSAPLKVTTVREIEDVFGQGASLAPIPLVDTLLSPLNLFVTGGLLLGIPWFLAALSPDAAAARPLALPRSGSRDTAAASPPPAPPTLSDDKPWLPRVLEDGPWLNVLLAGWIAVWAWRYYVPAGDSGSGLLRLTPDSVNLTMLMLGLLLHRTPARYARAIEAAARSCAGILLQFPLYAGIMGIMKASGLTALLAERLASTTDATTLPLLTFGSAALVNLFVPSGGGQWAVQGPVAIAAAAQAGVDPAHMVMAVAYGDELTNMLQPFWALPLLSITGVQARDIVGYTALAMVVAGAWMLLGLWLF